MNKKYEFTSETEIFDGHVLHRIKRLSDGELGGWIESEDNLSQEGNCWVAERAKVFGNAKVSDNAVVSYNAQVYDNAKVYGAAQVRGNAKVYGDACVHDNAKVCGDACVYDNDEVYGDACIYDNAKGYGNGYQMNKKKVLPEDFKYPVCITNRYYGEGSYMRSFTKQECLEYLARAIKNETDDGYFEYKTWEKTAADGTPAMGLIIYNRGYDEKIGYYDEEITLNFVNEKQLPVTWHDVEMFMKNKELEHETITDIPNPIEEPESESETSNEKEI